MDDDRLKRAGGGNYFEELRARIRDIRSSGRVFWRKDLDIYATSIDYDPRTQSSLLFFKTVQNKMHWAARGHTATEVIHRRDAMTQSSKGGFLRVPAARRLCVSSTSQNRKTSSNNSTQRRRDAMTQSSKVVFSVPLRLGDSAFPFP